MIITITVKEGRKVIEQFDVDLPKWVNWIAQDKYGLWFLYDEKPYPYEFDCTGMWCGEIYEGKPNPDWKDTLIQVSKITY